ncbi:OmpH family outer membrane protein [Alysiella filiformis]|uniref:Periplasmic chaperone for outer membrane proteins Skp n=1 Tax=Alysiella filiformis DSM 16848 TaxID=1120981 RepID=A0A286EN69_9NEIS|nr:OmpH family outer membrane protein [Alysiella filiformis]QMT31990.1 OmpH family outer membrane protein [Alysiella filiformis]UBQ57102.1 OmpH family outer membrane protein [Alysiella filiformis DSM 16848]SOD72326.1 periplasmic chaperone for outer membrane proteins Skp [Alysiella filiformis DSM 16848]
MFNFHKLLRQSAIVFAVSGSLNATAFAENMKFGYVHAERLYSQSKTAQGIELTLKKEFAKQQKQLSDLQAKVVQLQQTLSSGKLKGQQAIETERKLQEAMYEHRLALNRYLEEYNFRRSEEFAALQNRANEVIENLAQQEKYDLIVQEAVFVNLQYDITDRVIQLLDSQK